MGFAALRLLAQTAENSNRGLLVALYAMTIPAVAGIIASVVALLANRRQARNEARSGVREDLKLTLDEYRQLINTLRETGAEKDTRIDRLETDLAESQEELRKCRERARTRRR